MRLVLDTNVVLDVLASREPWLHDSANVLSLLESDEFDGIVAAHFPVVTPSELLAILRSQGSTPARDQPQ